MTQRFDTFEELSAWYSQVNEYLLLAYKFSGESKGISPFTCNAHSMFNSILQEAVHDMDGFTRGEHLEILY